MVEDRMSTKELIGKKVYREIAIRYQLGRSCIQTYERKNRQ